MPAQPERQGGRHRQSPDNPCSYRNDVRARACACAVSCGEHSCTGPTARVRAFLPTPAEARPAVCQPGRGGQAAHGGVQPPQQGARRGGGEHDGAQGALCLGRGRCGPAGSCSSIGHAPDLACGAAQRPLWRRLPPHLPQPQGQFGRPSVATLHGPTQDCMCLLRRRTTCTWQRRWRLRSSSRR